MAEKPGVKIVTPEGRLINPASCWVVALTWDDEKAFAGAVERGDRISGVMQRFGGGDLVLDAREAHRG